jgi:HK97 gp10 family phage protein
MATKTDGLAKLQAKFAALPGAVKTDMLAATHQNADEFKAMAKRLAPRDRGDLSESIEKIPGRHELAVIVQAGGPKAFYARWVEFGTVRMRAQPFFFPAYRALRRRMKGRASRASTKAAKRVAGNGQ